MPRKIISGVQDGVDIAGLRAAWALGLETGVWMPQGRRTESGPHPEYAAQFQMQEMTTPGYPPRTYQNVADSDATLVVCFLATSGVNLTCRFARKLHRPLLWVPALLDGATVRATHVRVSASVDGVRSPSEQHPIAFVPALLARHAVQVLNVAGNRSADAAATEAFLCFLLTQPLLPLEEPAPPGQGKLTLDL